MWRVHGVWLLSCGYWHACEQPFLCFKVRHLWDAYRRRKPFALGNISGRRNGVSINRLYARKQGSFNRLSVGLGWNLKSNRRHAGLVPTLDIGTSFAISKLRFESLWEYFHFGTGRSMLGDLSPSRTTLLGKHSSNNSGYNFFRFLRSRSPEIEVLYLLSKFILLSCLRRFLMAIPTSQFLQRILAKRQ